MKYLFTLLLVLVLQAAANAQTVTELYETRDFKALAAFEKDAKKLSSEELYMVGFAFFQLGEDEKAVTFYDKAMKAGLDDPGIHFYKGLSLRYLEQYREAMNEIETAIAGDPTNQEYVNEKGMVFYSQGRLDEALEVFEEAKKLPETFPEPYYWAARIHHRRKDFVQAVAAYNEALAHLPADNTNYADALKNLGHIECYEMQHFDPAIDCFRRAVALDPNDYDAQYRLISIYNAAGKYTQADSLFATVQQAYEAGKLPQEDMEIKSIGVAQFTWNDQKAVIRRSLEDPKESLDVSFKVFLLNKEGDQVVRRFLVEKTLPLGEDSPNHLLCERVKESGDHITYPYGWKQDIVPIAELEKAVRLVLDGKMVSGASSNFGK